VKESLRKSSVGRDAGWVGGIKETGRRKREGGDLGLTLTKGGQMIPRSGNRAAKGRPALLRICETMPLPPDFLSTMLTFRH
jgi:hypothetical protein